MWTIIGILALASIFGILHAVGVKILKSRSGQISNNLDIRLGSTINSIDNRSRTSETISSDRVSVNRSQVFNNNVSQELQRQANQIVESAIETAIENHPNVPNNQGQTPTPTQAEEEAPQETVPSRNFDAINDLEL